MVKPEVKSECQIHKSNEIHKFSMSLTMKKKTMKYCSPIFWTPLPFGNAQKLVPNRCYIDVDNAQPVGSGGVVDHKVVGCVGRNDQGMEGHYLSAWNHLPLVLWLKFQRVVGRLLRSLVAQRDEERRGETRQITKEQ